MTWLCKQCILYVYMVYTMSTMYAIHVMLNNAFTVWKYNLLQKKTLLCFCAAYHQLQVDNEHVYEQPVSINE